MADSFNSVPMTVVHDKMAREQQAAVSVRQIPGGNTSYIDFMGVQLRKVTLALFFTPASAYDTFEAQVGNTGTLTYVDGTFTAMLTSLKRTDRNLSTTGETHGEATFLIF